MNYYFKIVAFGKSLQIDASINVYFLWAATNFCNSMQIKKTITGLKHGYGKQKHIFRFW